MTGALAAITAAGILLPHALRLHRVPPFTAVALWLSSLALGAFACLLAAVALVFVLPGTGLFVTLTHWCAHVSVPARESPLVLEGHGIAQLALYAPGVVLGASLAWMCVASVHDARAARHLIAEHAVGRGPRGCLIVGGSDVLFAVAGLVHPRIMVSVGALAALDDGELAAGLNHEAGHIARRHRFVMLLAVALRALGRPVPGGGRALRELVFHLERDADRWALREDGDRAALASVMCKAAAADRSAPPAVARLDSANVPERLGQVLGADAVATRRVRVLCTALATGMVMLSLLIGAAVPAVAVDGAAADPHRGHHLDHCDHGA